MVEIAPVLCFSRTEILAPPGVSCLARKLTTAPPTWCSVSNASINRARKSLLVFPEKSACRELGVGEASKRSRADRKPAERRKRGASRTRSGRAAASSGSAGKDPVVKTCCVPEAHGRRLSEVTSSSVMINRVLAPSGTARKSSSGGASSRVAKAPLVAPGFPTASNGISKTWVASRTLSSSSSCAQTTSPISEESVPPDWPSRVRDLQFGLDR